MGKYLWLSVCVFSAIIPVHCQNISSYLFSANKVILEETNCRVTQGDLEYQRFLVEFILGSPLAYGDKNLLRSNAMDACSDRTASYQLALQSARNILNQTANSANPGQLGLLHSNYAYSYLSQPEDPDKAWVCALMSKYNPILAADSVNRIVFTQADAYALLNLQQLVLFVMTSEIKSYTNESWQESINHAVSTFQHGNQALQKYMATLQFTWIQTWMAWQKLTSDEKQELAVTFRNDLSSRYKGDLTNNQLLEDISYHIIQKAGITSYMTIDQLGSGKSEYFTWTKLELPSW
jgi:hypothetical protein